MTIRRKTRPVLTEGKRVRRDPPARTAPIRAWPGSLRSPDSWNADARLAGVAADASEHANHGVDGAKLGYEVIEQYMRQGAAESATRGRNQAATFGQGRRAAQSANTAEHRQGEIQDTIGRVFRSLSELMPLMADLVNSPAAAGLAQNLLFDNRLIQAPGHRSSRDAAARVTIELSSPRPATVSIELHPDAERRPLAIAKLHDLRGVKLVLHAIAFTPAKGRNHACLRLRLADGQRPGVYSGVLLDRSTGEPRGVLTIRLTR